MDPATIFTLVGGAVDFIGNLIEGDDKKKAAEYNASVLESNALQVKQKAAEDEALYRVAARKDLGSQRANYGASGVTTEGSAMDVLAETVATAEADAMRIRKDGENQANAYRQEATAQRMYGDAAKTNAYFGAGASALKTGATLVRK